MPEVVPNMMHTSTDGRGEHTSTATIIVATCGAYLNSHDGLKNGGAGLVVGVSEGILACQLEGQLAAVYSVSCTICQSHSQPFHWVPNEGSCTCAPGYSHKGGVRLAWCMTVQ